MTLTFRDVVELAATAGQAAVDPLTGLPSRHALDRRLGVMVDAVRRSGSAFALLMIDLNRYRELTDTLGRRAGELVLTQVGPASSRSFARTTRSRGSGTTSSSCS